MAARLGLAREEAVTADEHWEWASRLFKRMDRDKDGQLSPDELNCSEFQDMLRSIIAPQATGRESGSFGRSEQHISQLMEFCMKKADTNRDSQLSLEEFVLFTRELRNTASPEVLTEIIFALFDLDGDWCIDRDEFRGIYCFYLGASPMTSKFQAEWKRLDSEGSGKVSKAQFAHWLAHVRNPCFRQHASPVVDTEDSQTVPPPASGGPSPTTSPTSKPPTSNVPSPAHHSRSLSLGSPSSRQSPSKSSASTFRPAPGVLPRRAPVPEGPSWNERFAYKDPSARNLTLRGNVLLKSFFSRPQSLPELRRFYMTYQGFEGSLSRLDRPEPAPSRKPILSDETKEMMYLPGAERHLVGGNGRNAHGEEVPWRELTPRALKRVLREPGSMMLRVPMGTPRFITPWTERHERQAQARGKSSYQPSSAETSQLNDSLMAPRGHHRRPAKPVVVETGHGSRPESGLGLTEDDQAGAAATYVSTSEPSPEGSA